MTKMKLVMIGPGLQMSKFEAALDSSCTKKLIGTGFVKKTLNERDSFVIFPAALNLEVGDFVEMVIR